MTKLRLVAEWALLLLAAAALVFAAQQRGLVERLDLWLLDFASLGKAAEPNPDIVIVEIDDDDDDDVDDVENGNNANDGNNNNNIIVAPATNDRHGVVVIDRYNNINS